MNKLWNSIMKFLFEVNPNVFNVFIVSASAGQKQFWAKFDIFGGSCTDPFYRRGPNLVGYSRPKVYTYRPNFIWIVFMSASGGQKPQFWANFDIFWGSCTNSLLAMRAKFGVLWQTHGLPLPKKFRLDRFILSSCGGENPNFCRFLDFGI